MAFPEKIDLHMHTFFSDGSDTLEELFEHVREAGIGLFSVTDHDSIQAGEEMAKLAVQQAGGSARSRCISLTDGILCLNGTELSCRDEDGKYHILAYGYDSTAAPIRELIQNAHRIRMNKVSKRLAWLEEDYGFVFDQEDIEYLYSLNNPGKPHFGILMAQHGYAASKDEAMTNYLNKKEFKEEFIRPEEAIEGILKSGGIPILAHPFYGDGDQLILGEEMKYRLEKLIDFGLQGLEAYYSGFTQKLIAAAEELAAEHDLLITAGSDYHGVNKTVLLGDTGLERVSDAAPGLKAFLERVL